MNKHLTLNIKVKWYRYRPGVAQRVGRGIALLIHDRGTRRGWVVSRTPRSQFIPGKDPVPILQEAGWAPGPVCTGGKSRPHRNSIPDRPARSNSLYQLSYPSHNLYVYTMQQQPPSGSWPPYCRGFMITLRNTTIGRTPLDERSARRSDL